MELNTVVYVKVKVGLNHDVLSRTFLVGLHRVPFRTSSLRRTKDDCASLNVGPYLVSYKSNIQASDKKNGTEEIVVYVKVKVGLIYDVLNRTFLVGLQKVPFRTFSLRSAKDDYTTLYIGPHLDFTN